MSCTPACACLCQQSGCGCHEGLPPTPRAKTPAKASRYLATDEPPVAPPLAPVAPEADAA